MKHTDQMLLDDFSGQDGMSALGTAWRYFADPVMGGVSRGSAAPSLVDRRPCMRLQGEVSLENNGGFIQVALPLSATSTPFDARAFTGLRLRVWGNGETYYVHLRTSDATIPRQYYFASFATADEWTEVEIPFSAFAPKHLGTALDPSKLTRVGIVAARKAHTADVAVSYIGFYSNETEPRRKPDPATRAPHAERKR